ncbi:H/ACA ribonucleoprotein complex non-core subunit NAF1-like isoform X2 [Hylaeus volcanicus]|uniref:H/ACA ribonucleoprotein complex non-core subunit NAF1-like isoform X2 n=1 Tax=Hylaeus volcanicus TaxID=313075 RepID=UPI0023B77A9C|nr:H/ACA ribonucleoprotein complex non-core subunit NAF1-like isoform X2 [Hylaeus volcanicus]
MQDQRGFHWDYLVFVLDSLNKATCIEFPYLLKLNFIFLKRKMSITDAKGNVNCDFQQVLIQHTENDLKPKESFDPSFNQVNEPLLIIDGEAEVDDLLFAACFANYESAALKRMELLLETKPVTQTCSENVTEDILKLHNLQCITDDDEEEEEDVEQEDTDEKTIFLKRESQEESLSDCDYDSNEDSSFPTKKKNKDTQESTKTQSLCGFKPIVFENLPDVVNDSIELIHIGKKSKPVDLGSVLCTSSRHVLGIVSDTFGPVASPFYLVCDIKVDVVEADDIYADGNNFTFIFNGNEKQTLEEKQTESTQTPCQNMQRHPIKNRRKNIHLVCHKQHVKKNLHPQILNKTDMGNNFDSYQNTETSILHNCVDNSFINQTRCQERPPWSYQTPQTVNPHFTHYTHTFHQPLPSNIPNSLNSETLNLPTRSLYQNFSAYPPSQSVPTRFQSSQCVANQFSSNQCVPNHFAKNTYQVSNIYNGVQRSPPPPPPQFFSTHTTEHQNPDPFQKHAETFTYRFDR